MDHRELPRNAQLLHSFYTIHRNLARLVRRTAERNGLTVPQFSVLMIIAPHKKMTQKQIGERILMPKSTLSLAVDGLVKAGFIHRGPVKGNRRELELTLSAEGEQFVKELNGQEGGVSRVFQNACDTLSEEKFQELLSAHRLIAEVLEKEQGDRSKC